MILLPIYSCINIKNLLLNMETFFNANISYLFIRMFLKVKAYIFIANAVFLVARIVFTRDLFIYNSIIF